MDEMTQQAHVGADIGRHYDMAIESYSDNIKIL
jgi:hypothetical protein